MRGEMMENSSMKRLDILMKKMLMFAAATVAVAAGCQKFRGEVDDYVDPLDDGRPVKIEFGSNVVGTKASLTGLNDTHDLYIYGLNRSKPGVGEIENAKAHMAKPADAGEVWALSDGTLKFADNKTFFYNGTKDLYEFYGYHVASAATVPEKLTDYRIDVTIDGTQDILLGKAYPENDITGPGVNTEQVTNTDNVYSAWSTRRGVVPKLVFGHALAQYTFEVRNSGMQAVVLQSLEVTSKTNGVLSVIDQNLTIKEGDTDTKLSLNSKTFVAGGAILDPKGDGPEDDVKVDGVRLEKLQSTPIELDGEIMTFAGQDNKVVMRLVQKGMKDGQYRQITMPITLDEVANHGSKTMPGYSYLVSIVVYSLEEVGMTVSLTGWKDGGTVSLDQEVEAGKPGTGYEDEIYPPDYQQQ